jgi:hypothetical protein
VKLLLVIVPVEEIVQATGVIMFVGVLVGGLQEVSVVLNPLPVIVTPVVTGPELGVSVMVGPMTVKTAEA